MDEKTLRLVSGGRVGGITRTGAHRRFSGLSERLHLRLEGRGLLLGHLPAGAFGAEFLPDVAQLLRVIAHNLVQAHGYHVRQLLTSRCALGVQCMHICTCAPNAERIPLYTVNLAFTFNNLVRGYAPNLYPVVDGVAVDAEELGGLTDGHVPLLLLALLCALCAVLCHAGIVDPSETSRRPSGGFLARLAGTKKGRRDAGPSGKGDRTP